MSVMSWLPPRPPPEKLGTSIVLLTTDFSLKYLLIV